MGLAVTSLNSCLDKARGLSELVDRLTVKTRELRSKSLADLRCESVLGQGISKVTMGDNEQPPNPRTCHHCHRLLNDPDHVGMPTGVDRCTLEHWEGCPGGKAGGRDSNGGVWTACPAHEDADLRKDAGAGKALGTGADQVDKQTGLPSNMEDAVSILDQARLSMLNKNGSGHRDSLSSTSSDSSGEEEIKIRQEELEKLKKNLAKIAKDKRKAEKKEERRVLMEKLDKERSELLAQSRALGDFHRSGNSASGLSSAISQSTEQNTRDRASDALKQKVACHAAKQQQHAADRAQTAQTTGLTMPGIRSLPGMTPEVEQYLSNFQSIMPSLAKPPTASVVPDVCFQPPGVFGAGAAVEVHGQTPSHQQEDDGDVDDSYVYVAKLGKLVKVVQPSPPRSGSGFQQERVVPPSQRMDASQEDEDTSDEDDCPLRPEDGFHFIWKRDNKGRKYFVSRPDRSFHTESTHKYVYDKETGRTYREVCSSQAKTPKRKVRRGSTSMTQQRAYVDHRQAEASRSVAAASASVPPASDERMSTFLSADGDRQGRETKVPELVQLARDCPVSWTNKVTLDKMNVVLFAWSYVSALLAARTGRAPDLEKGELEARMQHLLHVLEVTLQTCSQTEYSGDSWKVARLYHTKVQQKVDGKQASWVQLTAMHHNATLPHELMASMQELASKPKPKGDGRGDARGDGRGDGKGDGKTGDKFGDRNRERRRTCGTWNRSEIRGKCGWETEHPGEKCKYLHECAWCKSKRFTPVEHQRFFCKKRLEAEED